MKNKAQRVGRQFLLDKKCKDLETQVLVGAKIISKALIAPYSSVIFIFFLFFLSSFLPSLPHPSRLPSPLLTYNRREKNKEPWKYI